jgi:hypothetical protein
MKITDLFHALRRGTAKNKERGPTTGPEKPRQTDSANADASGDSRERPAFDFKQLPDVDDATVEAFFSATHEGSRRMPLLVAQWVYAQLENELTSPSRLDERRLAEIRGGMMALRRFAVDYTQGIEAWRERKKRKDGEE